VSRRYRWLVLAIALSAIALVSATAAVAGLVHPSAASRYRYERLAGPGRTVVHTRGGAVVATLTDGARTAVLTGPQRVFAEPATTDATVSTRIWVRLLPQVWYPGAERLAWFDHWLAHALGNRDADLLAIATQYLPGAADRRDAAGLRYAGGASYGPLTDGGGRAENSDFNDYLGVAWKYPDGKVDRPNPDRLGALDCSGFVRMVYGYRSGYPLEIGDPTGQALPRRAVMMAGSGPGVPLLPDTGRQVTEFAPLQGGDLVFFDADPNDGPQVDHVGIYLGVDSHGGHRFLSSRKTANGPTFGDVGGASLLDGEGLYAHAFRTAKRL
jgi:hypothetical protein